MSNCNTTSGGTSILGLLGVVFVTLKLTGYIDWSWWYVTMPFWFGPAIILVMLAFAGLVYLGAVLWDKWNLKNNS